MNRNKELLEAAFKLLKLIISVFVGVVIAIWNKKVGNVLFCFVLFFFIKCRGFMFLKTCTFDAKYRYFKGKTEKSHLLHPKISLGMQMLTFG